MKQKFSVENTKLRYFNALRALALTALICTVALTLFILIQSVLPNKVSGAQSDFISGTIQSAIGKGEDNLNASVPFFGSYRLFMRKLIGHFLVFAVLGAGLSASSFLLIKPRAAYPVIGILLGFIIAVLSETLQLPIFTSGRVASWSDVGIDMLGLLCGIAFVSLVLLVYVLIKRKVDKSGYSALKETFKATYICTEFRKHSKILISSSEEYKKSAP